jgi:hypothetical protein
MAIRSVATTDTIETFRTTFNSLGTDVGDLTTLSTTDKSSIVAAVNEALGATFSFTLRDSSSSVQTVTGNDTLNVVGASNEITAVVSATDTLTIGLADTISGITSLTASTLSDGTASLNSGSFTGLVNVTGSGTANFTTDVQVNSVSVSTKPFAIAQAIALG